ncbi:FKBP-type peptidyl-prolyl cis-trans isomerase [Sphingobacterium sp. DN00404]|uniref:Peptidyl-prolyl cis-trans isomerase n=1 Tax=Sphingobacterium micropteri TaxID=2763501 RepID=A0ABR7YS98_9SPHI|nr:FKBP-type peptidyl-prolyl cis-trans isomerase [Sphingobacterium micropteri]MBD1434228.1 FKBP-type peptidyl-prolyl cis-trans isomerase [Sphingobacterium micropteri]
MKNLSKFFFLFLLATIGIVSCSKSDDNNANWAEEQRRRDSLNRIRIEALLEEQAPELKAFAEANFGEDAQFDDSTGIWFKVHEPGEEGTYTRWLVPGSMGGLALASPTVEVKYVGKLMRNGEIFDQTPEDDPEDDTRSFQLGGVIPAWNIAFYPKEVRLNEKDYKIGGITEKGLQKGAIIEFVAPSPYCYDNTASDDIPADSPLHFYIEVVDIKDKK